MNGRVNSKILRNAANGQDCTFNISGVCNYDTSTTVLCHIRDELKGMGNKASDLSAAFGCSSCHDAIDSRNSNVSEQDRDFYALRAIQRTHRALIELGIISVRGAA